MKKLIKFLEIAVLASVILFAMAACSDSGSGGGENITLPPAGDGSISFASVRTYDVYELPGDQYTPYTGPNITFTKVDVDGVVNISTLEASEGDWVVKIDGTPKKFSLKLGTPKTDALIDAFDWFPSSLSYTSGLKVLPIECFFDAAESVSAWWEDEDGAVLWLVYANINGTISGSFYDPSEKSTILVNMDLKQGWNTVKWYFDTSTPNAVTGSANNSFWVVIDW